jgi:hypothetical protein
MAGTSPVEIFLSYIDHSSFYSDSPQLYNFVLAYAICLANNHYV